LTDNNNNNHYYYISYGEFLHDSWKIYSGPYRTIALIGLPQQQRHQTIIKNWRARFHPPWIRKSYVWVTLIVVLSARMMVLRFTIQGNSSYDIVLMSPLSLSILLIFIYLLLMNTSQEKHYWEIIIMTDSQMVIVNTERDVERTQNSSATEASSTASDSPTPTNSVQDKNWVHWHGPSNELLI